MKVAHHCFCWLLSLLPSALLAVTPANQRALDQLAAMTTGLGESDLAGFLAKAEAKGWSAPKMYSEWFIGRLPDDDDGHKRVEQARSQFGLEFARKLSEQAKVVRETKVAVELERSGETLFAAVRWLDREHGYSNLVLQARAYDIASVVAAKLMADLNHPIAKAEAWMRRFDWAWATPEFRRQVLFEESGGTHFAKPVLGDQQAALQREWSENFNPAQEPAELAKHPDLAIFTLMGYLANFQRGEVMSKPETCWASRSAMLWFVEGFGSVNLRNLESLHEFRKRYGQFPSKPKTYKPKPGESDIEAAFWELSWQDPMGVGAAYIIFSQYVEGRLMDAGEDSWLSSEQSRLGREAVEAGKAKDSTKP
jgi:hypothetical protein